MLEDTDALLVVDVQRDFEPGGALAVPDGDQVTPVLAACIESFVRRGLPVFASRDWHPADHCSFKEAGGPWPPHCIAGSTGAQLDPDLHLPSQAVIVDKARTSDRDAYSAFEGTRLDARLKELGVHRLYIGGLATEYCVLNSALDARRLGYDVVLLTDAVRALDEADGERAIEKLRRQRATISDSGAVLHAGA